MPYITIADAAVLAGVSKRTLHRWIAAGKIPARHANKRDMTVLDSDVTYYVSQLPQKQPPAGQETAARIDAMIRQIAALEARLDALEQEARAQARGAPTLWQDERETEAQSVSKTTIPASLPEGSMIAAHFAKLHKGVIKERTLTGHLADELHPVTGIKIGRTWWMTPIQQESALRYYRTH